MWRVLRRAARLVRLPLVQQLAAIAAAVVVLAAHVVVRLTPYSRYRQWLRPRTRHRPRLAVNPRSIGIAIERASRAIPGTRCLVQAAAAQVLYRLLGFRTFVHIGAAAPVDGTLRAHAWITLDDGAVVLGDLHDLDEYVPFPLGEAGRIRL